MASSSSPPPPAPLSDHTPQGDEATLTYAPLDAAALLETMKDPAAGATVLFVGTTRDEFEGKKVHHLEYESYVPLALRTLLSILLSARSLFPITRLHISHRLGSVGVTEASILVCALAPHRRAAFEAAEWMLEETKRRAQVWKKECYEEGQGEEGEWKANKTDNEWYAARERQI